MINSNDGDGISEFKQAQLRHRRSAPINDIESLLDFSSSKQNDCIYSIDSNNKDGFYNGPLFGIDGFSGFLYAPQALSPSLQQDLAFAAVSEYCQAPHATNIDLIPLKIGKEENNEGESMWNLWKQQNGYGEWPNNGVLSEGALPPLSPMKKYRSFSKLSWSTMGYQYDWTARAYHEGAKSPMPTLLEDVVSIFAKTALFVGDESTKSTNFTASACIVNFYNIKSNMGGHRDDLELALDKPVISLSLGLPAIFLLGGKSKDDSPVLPILVRPGDVMILGGDSRLCYHGMARVLPANVHLPPVREELVAPQSFQVTTRVLCSDCNATTVSDSDQRALTEYLSNHRININVRQVLPDGMDRLPPVSDDGGEG